VPSSLPGQHGVHRDHRPRNQHAALQLDKGQGTQGHGHQRPLRLVLQGATFTSHQWEGELIFCLIWIH
jgi:hypothetical protein